MIDLRTAPRSDTFGVWPQWRKDAGLAWHAADDIGANLGTPIAAPDDGEVMYSGAGFQLGTLGYYTIFDAGDYGLLMAHQDREYPELVRKVKRGDVIGYTGNTGWSTGPHVHVVMSRLRFRNGRHDFAREAGGLVNPRLYWASDGYRSGDVFTDLFGMDVPPGIPRFVVSRRIITKHELILLGRAGVETVSMQLSNGDWLILGPTSPAFTYSLFPALVPSTMPLMVNR